MSQKPASRPANVVCFEAAPAPELPVLGESPTTKRILGYVQSVEPACKGGTCNSKAVRVRPGGMRALARSFVGQAFISGHNWEDTDARLGTITAADKWQNPANENEIGVVFTVELNAEGLEQPDDKAVPVEG